jgi:thymidylate kinase
MTFRISGRLFVAFQTMSSAHAPKIISFSGIDGAGKSTQISALKTCLAEHGLRVKSLEFWDDVVVFSRFREFISYKAFKGDQGIGTPEKPLNRRDKNVTSLPVTVMRLFFYLADSVSLRLILERMKASGADVVICDRYLYDELANLPLNRWFARAFVRLALWVSPKPDAAFLIDADPGAARARKPEYPLEFLRRNRESYLTLRQLAGRMILIEPSSIEAAEATMKAAALERISHSQPALSQVPLAG